MNPATATCLRTNLRLLSLSIAVAIAAWLALSALLDEPAAALHAGAFRTYALLTGLIIMLVVRHLAKRAFINALATRQIEPDDSRGPVISERCPNAWLVQLHLELNAETLQ